MAKFRIVVVVLAALAAAAVWAGAASATQITYTVNSTGDDPPGTTTCTAPCTLRDAILAANAHVNDPAGPDTIAFNLGFGAQTITLSAELPAITDPVVVDGHTEPGWVSGQPPLVEVNGANVAMNAVLTLNTNSSQLVGLSIHGAKKVCCTSAGDGVIINGDHNEVRQGYIGNWNGSLSPNGGDGVFMQGNNNVVGGPATGSTTLDDRSIVSGNGGAGITVANSAGQWAVENSVIGLSIFGSASPNQTGVNVAGSSAGTVGGEGQAQDLIAGNTGDGVVIASDTFGVVVAGSWIHSNGSSGINIGGHDNTIGGTTNLDRNTISGNGGDGIFLHGSTNTIEGNFIGLTTGGTAADGNGLYGIEATGNTTGTNTIGGASPIGGASAGPRNVISGNAQAGIAVQGFASPQTILGNYVGTDETGSAAVANRKGVIASVPTTIGGSNADEGNLISGNTDAQVELNAADTVAGNVIGLDAAGTGNLNQTYGSFKANAGIDVFAPGAVIGGPGGAHNVISGAGINIWVESSATGATIENNYIGTNVAGTAAVASPQVIQRVIVEANDVTVGGPTSAERNVISDSDFGGVTVDAADNTSIFNNYIGTDKTGTVAIGNYEGVIVTAGSTNTHVGGGPSKGNLISGNNWGIYINGGSNAIVDDNKIGTNASGGDSSIGNAVLGLDVRDTSTVTVGSSYKNTIAYNAGAGIGIDTTSGRGATIRLNSIHDNAGLGIDIGSNGVTANDSGYGHQNFPVITSADNSGVVKFTLDTTAATYQIDIFRSTSCDPSGNGEGETNLVGRQLVVGSTGSQTYTESGLSLSTGQFITATATGLNGAGDTSEFSNCFQVTSAGPQTYKVDRTDDASGGSLACTAAPNDCDLRSAITLSNATVGDKDTIAFAVPALSTIQPTSPLPDITDPVTIDGSTQPGYTGTPLVRLDGSSAGAAANGLHIVAGNSTVRGLSITGFGFDGIRLETGDGNLVAGNWIGVDLGGAAAGNGAYGVETRSGSANNVIGGAGADRNVISANGHTGPTYSGVGVFDPGATGNVIKGNFIGTDAAGTSAPGFGNGFAGVLLRQTGGNSVGVSGVGNVVSGNGNAGVYLDTESNDTVAGNLIGTNAAGTAALANGSDGVTVSNGSGTTIGGSTAGERNVISGNSGYGVQTLHTAGTAVQGNYIGVDAGGNTALGNGVSGVRDSGSTDLRVGGIVGTTAGGSCTGQCNVLSGNHAGIEFEFDTTALAQGNFVGVGADGLTAIPNHIPGSGQGIGITVLDSPDTQIGGATPAARNVIGNNDEGILVFDSSDGTVIQGNYVGLGTDGNTDEGNKGSGLNGIGIDVLDSNNVQVGGPTAPEGNVASGNDQYGIHVKGSVGTTVQGNRVGTNAAGGLARPNGSDGIFVEDDGSALSKNTTIGGDATNGIGRAPGNLVSGNSGAGGIDMQTHGTGTTIQGNLVGTTLTGDAALGNGHEGILVESANTATIGGATASKRNVASGNGGSGILLLGAGSVTVQGNYTGTDSTGIAAVPNGFDGIGVNSGANNIVTGNLVSGNQLNGIALFNGTGSDTVQGNLIGTKVDGSTPLGNGGEGVRAADVDTAMIGGPSVGQGNTIANNGSKGINVFGTSQGVTIERNSISANGGIGIDLGNDGVTLNDPADVDTGPNGLQNFPVLTSAQVNGGATLVSGSLNSTTGGSFTVDFYDSSSCDPSGNGEGAVWAGSAAVTTDGSGNSPLAASLPALSAGDVVTATATNNTTGETSEFSACTQISSPVSATFNFGTTTPSVSSGAQTVPINGIQLTDLTQGTGSTASAALGGIPIERMALGGIALGGIALGGIGITPQLLDSALGGVHLADIPLQQAGGWPAYLQANAPALASAPLDTLTLGEVLPSIPATGTNAVHLADLDLSHTALGGIALGGIALGPLLLSNVPLRTGSTTAAQNLADWCAAINNVAGFTCPSATSLTNDTVMAWALKGLPLDQIGLENAPLAGIDATGARVNGIALGGIALGGIALGGINLNGTALGGIALGGINLRGSALGGIALGGINLNGTALGGIALGGINLQSSALGGIALGGINLQGTALGGIALGGINLSSSALGGIALGGIAADTLNRLVDCSNSYCLTPGLTLAMAQRDGRLRTGATLADLPVSLLSGYTLRDLGSYGSVTLAQLIASLTNPTAALGNITIADLIAALNAPNSLTLAQLVSSLGTSTGLTLNDLLAILPPGFTVHDLLAVILGRAGYDWGNLNLATFPIAGHSSDGGKITYTASYTISGGGGNPAYTVHATLPAGGLYVPGSSRRCVGAACVPAPIADPTISGSQLSWSGNALLGQPYTLQWQVAAPVNLGSYAANANITAAGLANAVLAAPVNVQVGQSYDSTPSTPGDDQNNVPGTAPILSGGNLYVSQLIRGDTDYYRIPIGPYGSRVDLTLSHIPTGSDYDLTVAGPPAPRLRGPATGGVPLTNSQLPDTAPDLGQQTQPLPPEALQDIPSNALTTGGNVIRGISDNRGNADEHITLISEGETGFYVVQVSNYAGADTTQPYVLEVESSSPPNLGACKPRTLNNTTSAPASAPAPTVGASTNTLFLVDEARLRSTYDATSVNTLMSKVSALAARTDLGINGSVIHVEAGTGVPAAYTAWDGSPCDPQGANAVVTAIGRYLDTLEATAPNLKYIVLVGGDDIVPFARVPDETQIANERGYADSLISPDPFQNNEYRGASGEGFLLTDDVWGERGAPDFLGHELFVPEIATGRLVESPADMSKTIDGFTSASGLLTPTSSLVTGYDFLTDGAQSINQAFSAAFGTRAQTLINESWTRSQLLAAMFPTGGGPTLNSINAHFDHHRLLPANENAAGTEISANLVTTSDIPANAMAGRLGFSIGCHSGLVVSDAIFGAANLLSSDWAQAMLGNGALGWIGNTGYGLGDTTDVAYSERLHALFARKLDGSLTLGQALAFAKQDYVGTLGVVSPYDAKVVMESTLYGLPMLRLGPGIPPTPPPPLPLHTDPATNLQAASFDVSPTYSPAGGVTTANGTYFKADDGIQSTPRRPLEPLVSVDVTEPGLVAHGALLRTLASGADLTGFNAVFSQVITDNSADDPSLVGVTAFPSKPQSISTFSGPSGQRQRLNLVTGLFRSDGPTLAGIGTQRNYTRLTGDVLYSSSSDWTPPTLGELQTLRVGATGTIGLATTVTDVDQNGAPGTVKSVIVIYRDCNGGWRTSSLTPAAGNSWSGGGTVTPAGCQNIDYYLEAADAAGNVAVSSKKVQVEPLVAPPDVVPQGASPITHTLVGTLSASGWYTSGVQVTLSSGDPISYSLDGAPNATYSAPFAVTGDGVHIVTASTQQGATHTFGFVIDATGPTTKITRTPGTPDVNGYYTFSVLLQASAVDSGGSDVAQIRCVLDPGTVPTSFAQLPSSCPYTGAGASVLAEGTHTIYAAAIDTAGNPGPLVSDTFKLDRTGPTTTINPLSPFQTSPSYTVAWTGNDGSGSGVKNFDVRYRQAASSASTFGSYVAWQNANPATSAVFTGTLGTTTCFSGRARDNAGWTTSTYSPEVCTVAPLDDTSLTRSGFWSTVTASDLYGGSASRSTSVGSTLTSPTMAGKQIGVLVTKQPGGGTIQLRWNGFTQVTQSLSAASRQPEQLVSFTLGSVQSGTLQVYVSGAGTVDVDAAGAYKTP